MRLALTGYNPVKDCKGCEQRDEGAVSAYILSYQITGQLLKNYFGAVKIEKNLFVQIEGIDEPVLFDLETGNARYQNLTLMINQLYAPEKGIDELTAELLRNFNLNPDKKEVQQVTDYIFNLFLKLIEIFHARCGLHITSLTSEGGLTTWELSLCENGPKGWINSEGLLRNRFGEEVNLREWQNLRPEKVASYVFGFYNFCRHYKNPLNAN